MTHKTVDAPSRWEFWLARHFVPYVVGLFVLAVAIVVTTLMLVQQNGPGEWWRAGTMLPCIGGYLGARRARRVVAEYRD